MQTSSTIPCLLCKTKIIIVPESLIMAIAIVCFIHCSVDRVVKVNLVPKVLSVITNYTQALNSP